MEIAAEVGLPKEEIVMALDAIQTPLSLYEPVFSEGGDTLYVMDQISDKKNREDNWVEDIALREAVSRLPERERNIIRLRFSMAGHRWKLPEMSASHRRRSAVLKRMRFVP